MTYKLDATQHGNAVTSLQTVYARGMPSSAGVIVIMTEITESNIRRLANPTVPDSLKLPHDGTGSDHDSVGILQQRASWGPLAVRMDVSGAVGLFLDRLAGFNYGGIDPWAAAQKVQVSAFEDGSNYKAHYNDAKGIVDDLWGDAVAGIGDTVWDEPIAGSTGVKTPARTRLLHVEQDVNKLLEQIAALTATVNAIKAKVGA